MRGKGPKNEILRKVEKEQKVFQTEIEQKPNMIQRQFS